MLALHLGQSQVHCIAAAIGMRLVPIAAAMQCRSEDVFFAYRYSLSQIWLGVS